MALPRPEKPYYPCLPPLTVQGQLTTSDSVIDDQGIYNMSLVLRKPIFGVSDQVRHKPGCAITEEG